jgi:signal transduction histidine kinase
MATLQASPAILGGARSIESAKHPGATIAIVDDDADTRSAIALYLQRAGYFTHAYESGKRALEAMDAGKRPDLILFDLVMPGMSGWEFRVEQKRRPSLAQIPAVALSGDTSPYAAAIDASAKLRKPVDFALLCATIAQLLDHAFQRQLTLRALESDRAHALSMLVASVAHEINNPLTYVTGNVELALRAIEDGAPQASLHSLLSAVRDGAQRVAFIVQLLSTFADGAEHGTRLINPLRALDAAVRLAMHVIRPRARLIFLPASTPKVLANEARLAQVFLNLLVNAARAIPEGAPSMNEVRIRTDHTPAHAVFEITDTGPGIAPAEHGEIFEPFPESGAQPSSAGISLAITRDVVERFGGRLHMRSTLGKGTTFRIELPAVETAVAEEEPATQMEPHRKLQEQEPRPRILVIDDEPLVGRLVEAALSEYPVDVVTDPSEGMLRLSEGPYDLVLCDLKMPNISGIEIYARLSARRPELCGRFVLMTGAAAEQEVLEFVERAQVPVLRKPFAIRELQQLVRRLGASVTAAG